MTVSRAWLSLRNPSERVDTPGAHGDGFDPKAAAACFAPVSEARARLLEGDDRQWQAVREMLIEAKFKAESMLRDEKVMEHHGKLAFYSGWVAYADYVLAGLERAREDGRVERIL